jgi:ribosomal protein S18 acetylase RimI-like enzyme
MSSDMAIAASGTLAGFLLGRTLEGEFGRSDPEAHLETIGVRPASQGRGAGLALQAAFERGAARRGAATIRTAARWREHALLAFLDRCGFALAAVHVLERATAEDLAPLERDAIAAELLQESDIEGIARIDGGVAGFVMARMDYGDFGRAEPTAIVDTVGVDPLRARQGIGRALLSQLLLNLRGLGVERLETAVPAGNLPLLGFFYGAGFRPAERLSLVKTLGR